MYIKIPYRLYITEHGVRGVHKKKILVGETCATLQSSAMGLITMIAQMTSRG